MSNNMKIKTGPDPKLKYDLDWYEGSGNQHAEFNMKVRLEKEKNAADHKALTKRGYDLDKLTHSEWKTLASDYHYNKLMARLRLLIPKFKELGYVVEKNPGSISDIVLLKKNNAETVEGIIITSDEDQNRTLYPGIQLTYILAKNVKGKDINYADIYKGISFYNNGEDSCFNGNTHRWGFDYSEQTLEQFIEIFKNKIV